MAIILACQLQIVGSPGDSEDEASKVMKDPRLSGVDPKSMPLDGKQMFWGGFKSIVSM